MGEIDECVAKYGVRHIVFWDEALTYNRERTLQLCRELIGRHYDLSWCANIRVDQIDPDMLRIMKQAGCWKLLIGCESGIQKHLDFVGKNFTVEQVRAGVAMVHDAGIETFGTFIVGIPGETFADGMETIRFARSLKLDYATFLSFCMWPGSDLFKRREELGTHMGRFTMQRIAFIPHSMTYDEMCKYKELAYWRFYMRPWFLMKKVLSIRSIDDILRYMRGFMAYSQVKAHEFKLGPLGGSTVVQKRETGA
jgi:anaerobic magnesium-protoporphyrin IX monomethyl ester cyclase